MEFNSDNFYISERKLRLYSLNVNHESGGPKAKLFLRFGFTQDNPEALAQLIFEKVNAEKMVLSYQTRHGLHYHQEFFIEVYDSLKGQKRSMNLFTAWLKPNEELIFKLSTCYFTKARSK